MKVGKIFCQHDEERGLRCLSVILPLTYITSPHLEATAHHIEIHSSNLIFSS